MPISTMKIHEYELINIFCLGIVEANKSCTHNVDNISVCVDIDGCVFMVHVRYQVYFLYRNLPT